MKWSNNITRSVASLVIVSFGFISLFVAPIQASMVGTADILQVNENAMARQKVQLFLDRQDVAEHLQSWGVTADEAKARVAVMTDAEVAQLADQIDHLPAGGDILGTLLIISLIAFLTLLITDLTGLTDVFTFIDKR